MPKIIICGSSWGMGEWGYTINQATWEKIYNDLKGFDWPECPNYQDYYALPDRVRTELQRIDYHGPDSVIHGGILNVTHLGLEQYFKDAGYDVINLSTVPQSNKQTVYSLKSSINLISENDLIIWIQSDSISDLHPYETFQSDFTNYDSLIEKQKNLLFDVYSELNKLNRKIICLGGSGKLNMQMINQFKNLIPLITCITEFLLPDYVHPEIWFSNWYSLVDRQFDLDSIDKLLYNKRLQDSIYERASVFKSDSNYTKLFWPDGSHPNRLGHKLIFDYLIKHENIFRCS